LPIRDSGGQAGFKVSGFQSFKVKGKIKGGKNCPEEME
jgi:hypothetical protein